MLTDHAVDLYQELLHRLVRMRSCPIDSRLIDTDTSEHDIWCIRNVDAENADEFGHGLPQGLDSPSH